MTITYSQLRERADRYRNMVQERAKRRFSEAFGYAGAHYSCFHYAHNWQHLPSLTPAQKSACRYVLWLEREKLWAASRLVERIAKRQADKRAFYA